MKHNHSTAHKSRDSTAHGRSVGVFQQLVWVVRVGPLYEVRGGVGRSRTEIEVHFDFILNIVRIKSRALLMVVESTAQMMIK